MVVLPSITTVRSSSLVPGWTCYDLDARRVVVAHGDLDVAHEGAVEARVGEITLWLTATTRVPSERGSSTAST